MRDEISEEEAMKGLQLARNAKLTNPEVYLPAKGVLFMTCEVLACAMNHPWGLKMVL